ncbi:MAG TPA: AAA family ATPase, partial [Allocoleopsis sp.]
MTEIKKITVKGYKSLYEESSIEIRPLTIIAGANSSGKSSIMQPLLLMKQTLESSYDPGCLLLNGDHIKFTSTEQFFSKYSNTNQSQEFSVKIDLDDEQSITNVYGKDNNNLLQIKEVLLRDGQRKIKY